jgi:hypothetical protein
MAEESMTVTQHWLGIRPYVLIEFFDGGDGDADLRADVKAGCGIGSVSEIRAALEMALDSLPEDDGSPVAASSGVVPEEEING